MMAAEALSPERFPEFGLEDLPEGDRKPVEEPLLAPPPSDPLDPMDRPAERRLEGVRRQRKPVKSDV